MKLDRDDIVLVAGVRTAFGAFGGALKDLSANDLGVVAAKAALDRCTPRQERRPCSALSRLDSSA